MSEAEEWQRAVPQLKSSMEQRTKIIMNKSGTSKQIEKREKEVSTETITHTQKKNSSTSN
jgi:hypothetical protein